ncbi:MAG: hypothetical protein M3N14_08145 [Bacteroidota bacterium]|nr:hypothetical protein [Bacteroidota bacterium]
MNQPQDMKAVLSILLFFTLGLNNQQSVQTSTFKLNTFTKVPDDLMGCGDDYYLSKQDEKQDKLICRTNYFVALIHVNNKAILLKYNDKASDKATHVFTAGAYDLLIKNGALKREGDEDYTMTATITVNFHSKIVWTNRVVGGGGC